MTKLIPAEGQLIVKWDEEKQRKSGIIVQQDSDNCNEWQVIAISPTLSDKGIEVGDTIYFPRFASENIEISENGIVEYYKVIKYSSILAHVKSDS